MKNHPSGFEKIQSNICGLDFAVKLAEAMLAAPFNLTRRKVCAIMVENKPKRS